MASPRRVRTRTVLQMEEVECGAAALGMILGYFGHFVRLEELRSDCGVSRDGSSAGGVVRAARKHGLTARGLRAGVEALRELSPPFIVLWNQDHFLVVEGFRGDRVQLNDPAFGRYSVTAGEFAEAYSGIALTFEPGPEFRRTARPESVLRTLVRRLRPARSGFVFTILAGIALVLPGVLIPLFTEVFINDILIAAFRSWLPPLILGMIVVIGLLAALTWLQQYVLMRSRIKLSVTESSGFLWHLLRLPIRFYSQRFPGGLVARVQINDDIAALVSGQLAVAVLGLITSLLYAAVMFLFSPLLCSVGLVIACINLVVLVWVSQRRKTANQRLLNEQYRLDGISFGGLQMIDSLKAQGAESDFFDRWAGAQARAVNAQQSLGAMTQALGVVPVFLASLNSLVILTIGGLLVMSGDLSFGGLVAFQGLMASFLAPIAQLVVLGAQVQEAHGQLAMLDDIKRQEPDPGVGAAPPVAGPSGWTARLEGRIELRDVTFGYDATKPPLIENLSLRLDPGSRVAIVGPSGSGKSTLANLVCGLWEPWSGEILFDGVERGRLDRMVIANSLALVTQQIFLFDGTIADNLRLWDETLGDVSLVRAARDAGVHEVITARRGGYQARVDENGRNFSGGERQRLEIARALARDPRMVVLDEATSALDAVTEQHIDEAIRRRGCTSLIVAHRLSTIRDCDEIIVLDEGRVVERGRHEELVTAKGWYSDLMRAG